LGGNDDAEDRIGQRHHQVHKNLDELIYEAAPLLLGDERRDEIHGTR
jgi:hypothetical protein